MKTDKEKLAQMLLLDMQRWSVPVLKEALLFADDKCLEPDNATICVFGGNSGRLSGCGWILKGWHNDEPQTDSVFINRF